MNRLVTEIVKQVRDSVQALATSMRGPSAEIRTVFHGPPLHFLRPVFDAIVASGGLDAHLPSSEHLAFPVLLQVAQLPPATNIVKDSPDALYSAIRAAVADWGLMPTGTPAAVFTPLEPRARDGGDASSGDSSNPVVNDVAGVHVDVPSPSVQPNVADIGSPSPSNTSPNGAEQDGHNVASVGDGADRTEPHNGINVLVGTTVDGFRAETTRLHLSDTNLNQLNIGVVGDLGTGKTQLLKSLVFQINQSAAANQGVRPRFLMFDYKKDYSSADFVTATGARVVKPHRLPINLFDVSGASESTTPWLERFKFFADILDKIFSGIGPVQRAQLKQAVKQAYEECSHVGKQPTIYDVHAKYRAILGNRSDSPLSIIDDLVDMELFSPEPGNATTTEQFLDGVVVIALNALGQDDRTKNMLVAIMLNMFYEHMLRIPKRPYVGVNPQLRVVDSFLLVDEADNIMRYEFDVLRKILLQGREFGVGVILASQYLRHFKAGATDYREPLLTWFIHKVPNITPQELGALGLPSDVVAPLAERIKTLALHHCLYKTQGVAGDIVQGTPFYQLLAAKSPPASG